MMDFILFLTFLGVAYCSYSIYVERNDKEKPAKEDNSKKTTELMHDRLHTLIGKKCELTFHSIMATLDFMYMGQGIILDVDEEWVLLLTKKGKKEQKRLLRIANIKEVKEISEV